MSAVGRSGVAWQLLRSSWWLRGKKSKARRAVREEADEPLFDPDAHSHEMRAAVDAFEQALSRLRTTAAPQMLDRVAVEAYGATSPIRSVAQITQRDAKTLVVDVYDAGISGAVEKAIRAAGLGLNPRQDGPAKIVVPVPKASVEKRALLSKTASSRAEETRNSIRRVRRKALDIVAKLEHRSKDDKKKLESHVQRFTDDHVNTIDVLLKKKVKELDAT